MSTIARETGVRGPALGPEEVLSPNVNDRNPALVGQGASVAPEISRSAAANVLFLHNGGGWMRGSENALLTVLHTLDRKRIAPYLFSGNPELAAAAKIEGIETSLHAMPEIMIDGSYVKLQFALWARTLKAITSLVERKNISLIYCNGGSTCQVGYYAAKRSGIPVICHVHSPYNRRYIVMYRLHRASKVIFVSKAIERSIRGKQGFIGETEVVYNGVDTDHFRPNQRIETIWREKLALPQDAIVFGQVSSLIHRKGIDILLRAFQQVSREFLNARLVIVGDGEQRAEYIALAERLGVADFVKWVGQANPLPFYQHVFDVNVLASRSDAFPLSLLEAASCSLPNIAANVDGIPESVLDDQTGLLFQPEDVEELSKKMLILATNPARRKQLGQAGRRLIEGEFSLANYCQTIERVIVEQIQAWKLKTGEEHGV